MRDQDRRLRFSRREFLRGAGTSLVALAVPSAWARPGRAAGTEPVVVSIFLRGAADGLSLVVPHGDPDYAALRPTIQLSPGETLDIGGFYALHPSLAPLAPLYQDGSLAILHAVGSPNPTRSHFAAQDYIETAAPGAQDVTTGWLNRYLATQSVNGAFAGVSIGSGKTLTLTGAADTISFVSLDNFQPGEFLTTERIGAWSAMFDAWPDPRLSQASDEMLAAAAVVGSISRATSVTYPDTEFARSLRDVAALIKSSVGVRALTVDLNGFDHHTNANAQMPVVAGTLASALAAFQQDLGSHASRTLTLVMTEFGRTAAENGGGGADHGHGSVMFALGGGIHGGRVLTRNGQWPGLAPENLFENRDLAVTTDFRDVFAEVLRRHLGVADPSSILPGFVADPAREPGLWS
jgi:uncharacterized protein (DUF1501 family)